MYCDGLSKDVGHTNGHREAGLPGPVGVVVSPLVVVRPRKVQPGASNVD